ncbi:LamG-like jellyroll fold domain-containing protein [Kribbella sp. NPDC058245]|uniref:LamG-like jellyroll fold domain-containing protein n=1 Tax=Kribbella sp. NPDC058245 TaxID=3346399 RepID=UPI0036E8343A
MSSNRWSLRAFVRPISVLSITSVLAAGLAAVPMVAQAKPEVAPSSARTVADASRLAAKFNTSVEVEEKTTPYTRTVATPQGTLKAEISNEPVRVQKNGAWTAIDTSLAARPDGLIAPKVSTTDIAFSAGGSGPLARVTRADGVFELKSPWLLPAPTLSGSKATYAAVLPGVDLVVEATDSSFSYNLVVQNREAAANPALRSLTFPVTTKNLSLRTTQPGRPSYVDSSGRQVLTVGEPLMWDTGGASTAKTKIAAGAAVEQGPSGKSKRALMGFAGSKQGLTITPDQKLLTAADTTFPVVIDPTMNVTRDRNGWTAIWQLYPTTSFWKTTHSLGVGFEDFEQHKIVRTYFQFDVAAFTGKKIIGASLRTYEIHSASCSARGITVSRTAAVGSATTWNNAPGGQADVATANVAHGYNSSCPAAAVEFNVTNSVQYTATANGKTATFRLRATSETDGIAWKQFDSTGKLDIEYVAYPLPAYELGAATNTDLPSGCAPSTAPTVVASTLPQISGKGRVGAGDTSARIFVQWQILSPSGSQWTFNSPTVAPGVLVKGKPLAALGTNVTYNYKARTGYAIPGGTLYSAWTGLCYFRVDTTPPPAPTITASYNGQPLQDCLTTSTPDVCPISVPFGAKVRYTISSTSTDVAALSYGFNGKLTRVTGRSVTVDLLTPGQTLMTLGAVSHDAPDHTSTTKYHRINVGPGLPPSGSWDFDEGSGTTAADSSGKGHPLAVTGAQFDDAGRVGGSLTFDGDNANGNQATVSGAASVVDTSQNFTISAWVRPTAVKDSGVVAVNGTQAYGGLLRYSAANNRWAFIQNVSDSSTAAQARVDSLAPPVLNAWTHLLGVFNVTDKTIQLYVNGRIQATASFTHVPWKANGTVEVGSYRVGTGIGVFSGAIDDVKIYPRVMSATEANKVADPRTGPSGSDEPVASLAAKFPFDSIAARPNGVWVTDDTVYDQGLAVSGFGSTADQSSAIVEDPERGNVLTTTGAASELLAVNRPLVDSTGSFTTTLWVKIQDPTKKQVIVRQIGANKDPWRIEYRPGVDDEAQWVFSRATNDTSTGQYVEVTQPTNQTTAGEWTALAAEYNAATDQMTLLITDRSGDGGVDTFLTPVQGSAMIVARQDDTDTTYAPLNASLDDLRVYTGVVPQHQLCVEFSDDPTECS